MAKRLDVTGQKFGKLTALAETDVRSGTSRKWACICDCGNFAAVSLAGLRRGATKSCGCHNYDVCKRRFLTHGKSKSKEYVSWCGMKERCLNPNSHVYEVYSRLSHPIQESWIYSFEDFVKHIGEMPKDEVEGGYSVGRIDNEVGYVEGNVRWETKAQQSRNQSLRESSVTGFVGVSLRNRPTKTHDVNLYYAANWMESGKEYSKAFSVRRFGILEAFYFACKARKDAIQMLTDKGCEYGEKHGKRRNTH